MSTHNIHTFISHSWSYTNHYDKLAEWIFERSWSFGQASVEFKNYSVPKHDPIHNANNASELKQAIFNKIALCHVVVIPTGMYASYSHWIEKEIGGCIHYNKPIIAVNPWGQQRTSRVVQQYASETVGWNKDSVIGAIWRNVKK